MLCSAGATPLAARSGVRRVLPAARRGCGARQTATLRPLRSWLVVPVPAVVRPPAAALIPVKDELPGPAASSLQPTCSRLGSSGEPISSYNFDLFPVFLSQSELCRAVPSPQWQGLSDSC